MEQQTTQVEAAFKAPSGFFEESKGNKSSMRLFSFILLMFFVLYHLPFGWANARAAMEGKPIANLSDNQIWFDVVVLIFIFIPKAAQKIIELKFGKEAGTGSISSITKS